MFMIEALLYNNVKNGRIEYSSIALYYLKEEQKAQAPRSAPTSAGGPPNEVVL
jgi:hypothetical protein